MKNVKELSPRFSLEWERKAFLTVLWFFKREWDKDKKLFHKLSRENERIEKDNIESLDIPYYQSKDSNYQNLIYTIYEKLILEEPILLRIYIYNSILPEDINARKQLWDKFISPWESDLSAYRNIVTYPNLFKDTELSKDFKSQDGIPVRWFLVGQIIKDLLTDFRHFRLIDQVKNSGVGGSIEALRRDRIYNSIEGKVFDYTPLFKEIRRDNESVIEVFKEKDFKDLSYQKDDVFKKKDFKEPCYQIDDILCSFIKSFENTRRDEFFGENLDKSDTYFIVRYKGKEKQIPLQLLPKWSTKIKKEASKRIFFKEDYFIKSEDEETEESYEVVKVKEVEKQEATIGLYKGALTWDPAKGPATNWLAEKINWHLGEVFKELSVEKSQKIGETQITPEQMELSKLKRDSPSINEVDLKKLIPERFLKENIGSSIELDKNINEDSDDKETYKDSLTEKDLPWYKEPLSIEDKVFLSKVLRDNPELEPIFDKQKWGQALTPNERKIYERVINRLKKKYGNSS